VGSGNDREESVDHGSGEANVDQIALLVLERGVNARFGDEFVFRNGANEE
jgi:hypothetical protein